MVLNKSFPQQFISHMEPMFTYPDINKVKDGHVYPLNQKIGTELRARQLFDTVCIATLSYVHIPLVFIYTVCCTVVIKHTL